MRGDPGKTDMGEAKAIRRLPEQVQFLHGGLLLRPQRQFCLEIASEYLFARSLTVVSPRRLAE